MSILVTDLKKAFGHPEQEVLKGISVSISDGEFVSITGRSGSGKSTLLYLISSLDIATSGTVEIDGHDLKALSDFELHRFRNEQMGFIFQSNYLLPELTALENILMPARKTMADTKRRPRALQLLKEFGIESKERHLPNQMSGGEQQRVAIARALIMEPRYIFADEPTGNLDSANGDLVLQILKKVSIEQGATVVMVTHDPDYAAMADRTIQLVDGRLANLLVHPQ